MQSLIVFSQYFSPFPPPLPNVVPTCKGHRPAPSVAFVTLFLSPFSGELSVEAYPSNALPRLTTPQPCLVVRLPPFWFFCSFAELFFFAIVFARLHADMSGTCRTISQALHAGGALFFLPLLSCLELSGGLELSRSLALTFPRASRSEHA